MFTERSAVAEPTSPTTVRVASVLIRWLEPASGREIDAEAVLQDLVQDGIFLVRLKGPALPEYGHALRIVVMTADGPFVVHAKVARRLGPNAALVRPVTDARLEERRRWPRVNDPPVELEVTRTNGDVVRPRVLDLSVRGARFEARVPFVSGERLSVSLQWDNHRLATSAVIAAAVDLGNGAWVCRCRFELPEPPFEQEIALLINGLLPATPTRIARLRLNRVPATATVVLLGNWVEGDAFEIQLAELGSSTLRFSSSRRLKPGTALRIELAVYQPEPVMVEAEVTSAEQTAERWCYEAKFRSLPDVARRSILFNIVRFLITERNPNVATGGPRLRPV